MAGLRVADWTMRSLIRINAGLSAIALDEPECFRGNQYQDA